MIFEHTIGMSGTTPLVADARSKRRRTHEIANTLDEDPDLIGLQMNGLSQVPEPRVCLRLRTTFVLINVRQSEPATLVQPSMIAWPEGVRPGSSANVTGFNTVKSEHSPARALYTAMW
jgi:hypothetical protein